MSLNEFNPETYDVHSARAALKHVQDLGTERAAADLVKILMAIDSAICSEGARCISRTSLGSSYHESHIVKDLLIRKGFEVKYTDDPRDGSFFTISW